MASRGCREEREEGAGTGQDEAGEREGEGVEWQAPSANWVNWVGQSDRR